MTTENPFKITLTWEQCELIAHYYSFPETVFMLSAQYMKKQMQDKRRHDVIHAQIITLNKVKQDIKEALE